MNTPVQSLPTKSLVQKFGSPIYVYDEAIIRARCRELVRAFPKFRLYYACKANTNPEIIRIIASEGFGIETVSPGEIAVAVKSGVSTQQLAFTCGNIRESELISIARKKIPIHLDSLTQVEWYGKAFPNSTISVRLNLGVGAGHHSHVITGGPESKFGIDISHQKELLAIAAKYRLRITGLHQHIGSNILEVPMFLKAMDVLFKAALSFPDVDRLDFGGGFGVPYKPNEKRLDIAHLGKKVTERVEAFFKKTGRRYIMSFEPGRYIVAEAGNLVVTVTDIKRNPKKTFIGVDSGMGHLIRPAMYDSYHEIHNATHPRNRVEKVTIAGNNCESGDVFARDRQLAGASIGDILIIKNAGAYGYTMSSDYNLRDRPAEVLINKGKSRRIRGRGQ